MKNSPEFWQTQLKQEIESESLRSSYLLLGQSELTKPLALSLAAMLLPQRTDLKNHPDFECLDALEEDDDVSAGALRERLVLILQRKPYEGKRRVIVLLHFDRFSLTAQDVLLKPLEEPPADTLFFLTAPSAASLPETIRSRCQLWIVSDSKTICLEPAQRSQFEKILSGEIDSFAATKLCLGEKKLEVSKRRELVRNFLQSWILFLREQLQTEESMLRGIELALERALIALNDIDSQVTPDLVLENLFLVPVISR